MEAKRSIASPVLFIESTLRGSWQETFATVVGFYCKVTSFHVSFYLKRKIAHKMLSLPPKLCVPQMK